MGERLTIERTKSSYIRRRDGYSRKAILEEEAKRSLGHLYLKIYFHGSPTML